MGYPRSSFFNAPETARFIIGLECAIDREGLSDSSFVKRVRAEGALQVEGQRRDGSAVVVSEGYRSAWLQGLINHVLMLARMLLPTIRVRSPEDRKKWCLHRADEYFKQWMMLEEIDEDIDDSRVAKGMLLLRAYRTRFIRLEGQTLIDAMMENPPTDRAMALPLALATESWRPAARASCAVWWKISSSEMILSPFMHYPHRQCSCPVPRLIYPGYRISVPNITLV